MGILRNLRGALGRKQNAVRLDDPPAPGAASEAVASVSEEIRGSLPIEVRTAIDGYLEAVVTPEALEGCNRVLEAAFGPAVKPFGVKATFERELQAQVDTHGGVEKNQALYLRRYADGRTAFALLWPWSGGQHVTLKLGFLDRTTQAFAF